jgi:hypothetical protein
MGQVLDVVIFVPMTKFTIFKLLMFSKSYGYLKFQNNELSNFKKELPRSLIM